MKLKIIIHSDADGGYWAKVPALPGCVTEADTREELMTNLREAIEGWLEVAGAEEYVVSIRSGPTEVVNATTKAPAFAYPTNRDPLIVGTPYEVRVEAALAPNRNARPYGRSEFTVLGAPKRAAWRSLVGDIDSNEPASIRDLLIAQSRAPSNQFPNRPSPTSGGTHETFLFAATSLSLKSVTFTNHDDVA